MRYKPRRAREYSLQLVDISSASAETCILLLQSSFVVAARCSAPYTSSVDSHDINSLIFACTYGIVFVSSIRGGWPPDAQYRNATNMFGLHSRLELAPTHR